jgi:hypothetical protein
MYGGSSLILTVARFDVNEAPPSQPAVFQLKERFVKDRLPNGRSLFRFTQVQ